MGECAISSLLWATVIFLRPLMMPPLLILWVTFYPDSPRWHLPLGGISDTVLFLTDQDDEDKQYSTLYLDICLYKQRVLSKVETFFPHLLCWDKKEIFFFWIVTYLRKLLAKARNTHICIINSRPQSAIIWWCKCLVNLIICFSFCFLSSPTIYFFLTRCGFPFFLCLHS